MKDKYGDYLIYGLLFLVIGVLVFVFFSFSFSKTSNTITSAVANKPAFESISSGSTGAGDVSVELIPIEVSDSQLKVDVAVNTHSVDLSQFDLKQITTLEHDGKLINPISAPVLRGHHSNGKLIFNIDKETDSFTIIIKGIPKVEERIFTWP